MADDRGIGVKNSETSMHEMLESLKYLGLYYYETIGIYNSKLSKITLEIQRTTVTRKPRGLSYDDFTERNTTNTVIYWKKNEVDALYTAIVKVVPQDEWVQLSCNKIIYQQLESNEGTEAIRFDLTRLGLLQAGIDQTQTACTLKLVRKTERKILEKSFWEY